MLTIRKILVLCAGLALLAACSSFHESAGQQVLINTVPPQASCDVDREGLIVGHIDSTPGTITVQPDKDGLHIACSAKGFFKTIYFDQAQRVSGSGSGINWAVGAVTGEEFTYSTPITINLLRQPAPL